MINPGGAAARRLKAREQQTPATPQVVIHAVKSWQMFMGALLTSLLVANLFSSSTPLAKGLAVVGLGLIFTALWHVVAFFEAQVGDE